MEKPDGHHLNHVIKVDDASNGTNQHYVKNITVIFLQKGKTRIQTKENFRQAQFEKYSKKFKNIKNCEVSKRQKKMRNYSRLKDIKAIKLNVTLDFGL